MWDERCAQIFKECVTGFKENKIKYFVLRNYKGLPENNPAKDIDIIIEPGKLKECRKILLDAYKRHGIDRVYEVHFGKLYCLHGMSVKNKIGIHFDLIDGYDVKGYQVYGFNELYAHTEWYNDFCVLNDFMNAIMLLIYKQFGYKKPAFKDEYKDEIVNTYNKYPDEFKREVSKITSEELADEICECIEKKDFDKIIAKTKTFDKQVKRYVNRKRFFKTRLSSLKFILQNIGKIVFAYRKYARTTAVIAPDGAGKTTFIDNLEKQLNFYYVNSPEHSRMHVYHFRPTVLPNLGELGEKAGVMEQDKNFTDPHRGKPANPISSFFRMGYYTLDYIFGFMKCVRQDVHYDRHVLFDRYSYDFIVDPRRSKINLPMCLRRFFVWLTPQPKIVFVLDAPEDVIYARKQELDRETIKELLAVYRDLAKRKKRFTIINAEKSPDEMAEEAATIFIDKFTKKLD